MELAVDILILIGLFAASGFFSSTETALFSLTKIEQRRIQEGHPKLARWVIYHLDRTRRTLISVLTGNLLVNTFAASMITLMALKYFGPQGVGPTMIVFTVCIILFAEIIPKVIAVRFNESLSVWFAFPLHVFALAIFPFRRVTRLITDWILAFLIWEKKEHPDIISEQELKTFVKIGEEEGVLDREERQMINKLFDLGQRPAKAIMTPRTEVKALDILESKEEHVRIMKQYHYSHFPVYQESLDHVLGVVTVQDYMLSDKDDLKNLLREPLYVPASKRIDELLEEFRRKQHHFAVCVDEFGGTAGIVTLEDILEEIFGEYYDEYAKVEHPIRPHGFNEFIVEAKIPLDDFNRYFHSNLTARESTTLGGFILEQLGEVPQKGKVLKINRLEFHIHDVVRHRIHNVIVRRLS